MNFSQITDYLLLNYTDNNANNGNINNNRNINYNNNGKKNIPKRYATNSTWPYRTSQHGQTPQQWNKGENIPGVNRLLGQIAVQADNRHGQHLNHGNNQPVPTVTDRR